MRRELQIKICGNKFLENMKQVAALKIDWMGYIFYSASKRNVNKNIGPSLNALSNEIKRVGVFVNESISEIEVISKDFQLDIIQLHGDETLEYCHELKKQINLKIIKVFRIDETFDFDSVKCFEEIASYFLFDTKTNLKRILWKFWWSIYPRDVARQY